MEVASVIISTLALIISIAALTWQMAKHFSTHQIQMVPIDPFKDNSEPGGQVGKDFAEQFRDLGDPIDQEELERIAMMKKKKLQKI